MLDNIEINNFRSIENLKIENFKNVNFFFGRANSAKTSVLEALYIFLKEDALAFKDISDSRFNLLDDDVIEGLFLDYNTSQEIRIESKAKNIIIKKSDDKKTQITNGNTANTADIKSIIYSLEIDSKKYDDMLFTIARNQTGIEIHTQTIPNKTSESTYIGSFKLNDVFYSHIKQALQDNELENKLNGYCKEFESEIDGISIIDRAIYAKILGHNKKINLKLMGQGFISYLSYLTAALLKTKFICIDEIENGLHFEHINLVLETILELSLKHDIQFFITTHSKELLEQLAKIADENADFKDGIACFNLYKEDNKIKVWENKIDGFVINMKQEKEVRL